MKIDVKKHIIKVLPFILFGLFGTKFGLAYRLADGAILADKITNIIGGLSLAFKLPRQVFIHLT
jgi:hypothetical protein